MTEGMMDVWRINTRTQTLSIKPKPEAWEYLGEHGLLARISCGRSRGYLRAAAPTDAVLDVPEEDLDNIFN
jgi:hypothetical protein